MGIRNELHDAVLVVTIDRPERANALDPDAHRALGESFAAAEQDDGVRVVVLTGAGDRSFCAGMDLKAFAATPDRGAPAAGGGTDVFTERCYPKPVIAAVNGAAVGGGFGLAIACDLLVAAEHAVFGIPEVRRGLVGVGVTSRAALRLPPALALELALTGEPISAARAYALGLVNRVVPSGDALPVALALGAAIATNAPLGARLAKEVVVGTQGLHAVDVSGWRASARAVFASDDAAEGARAFAEKRAPRFLGH